MYDYERIIAMARTQVGYREGYAGGVWNNDQKYSKELPGFAWSNRQPWCDTFVAWVFWRCAMLQLLITPSAAVWTSYQTWLKAGRFTEYPVLGGQVIYGRNVHTGIVVGYDDNYVYTVEGNTNDSGSANGNGVYERRRRRTDPFITGYGVPAFRDGVIVSADPKFHTGHVTPPVPAGGVVSGGLVKVKRGDTLVKIAAALGVSLAALLAVNPQIKDPNVITPGQSITAPAKPGAPAAGAGPVGGTPTPAGPPARPTSAGGFAYFTRDEVTGAISGQKASGPVHLSGPAYAALGSPVTQKRWGPFVRFNRDEVSGKITGIAATGAVTHLPGPLWNLYAAHGAVTSPRWDAFSSFVRYGSGRIDGLEASGKGTWLVPPAWERYKRAGATYAQR